MQRPPPPPLASRKQKRKERDSVERGRKARSGCTKAGCRGVRSRSPTSAPAAAAAADDLASPAARAACAKSRANARVIVIPTVCVHAYRYVHAYGESFLPKWHEN